jgi:hypothetical protein
MFRPGAPEMILPGTRTGKIGAGRGRGRMWCPARAPLTPMTPAQRAIVRQFVEALLRGNGVQPASRTPVSPSVQFRQSLHAQQDGATFP